MSKAYRHGQRLAIYGKPVLRLFHKRSRSLFMVHPEITKLEKNATVMTEARLTPVYPATKGLTQGALRRLVNLALMDSINMAWYMPESVRARFGFGLLSRCARGPALAGPRPPSRRRCPLSQGPRVRGAPRPPRGVEAWCAGAWRTAGAGSSTIPKAALVVERLIASLPFALTTAQREASLSVQCRMTNDAPMQLLVQGDVGCGKTVVAAVAVANAVANKMQAAVLAPTELLAEQHRKTLEAWLGPLGIEVVPLLGRQTAGERQDALERAGTGRPLVAVGTHALFQAGVDLPGLALIVIDEQHRFGVEQRLALMDKGSRDHRYPHLLMLTATPIPRTLWMTAYADMDLETIGELPPGRMPVKTQRESTTNGARIWLD